VIRGYYIQLILLFGLVWINDCSTYSQFPLDKSSLIEFVLCPNSKKLGNWSKSVWFDRFRLIAPMFCNRDQLFSGPFPVTRLSKSSPVINHKMIYNSGTLRFDLYLRLSLIFFRNPKPNPFWPGFYWRLMGRGRKVLPGSEFHLALGRIFIAFVVLIIQ